MENTSFANSSDTETLRPLVTRVHQRRLPDFCRLLDTSIQNPLFPERIQRSHAQVTTALVLAEVLREMGFEVKDCLDLKGLIELAWSSSVLSRRETNVLKDINGLANEAMHQLLFEPRV